MKVKQPFTPPRQRRMRTPWFSSFGLDFESLGYDLNNVCFVFESSHLDMTNA